MIIISYFTVYAKDRNRKRGINPPKNDIMISNQSVLCFSPFMEKDAVWKLMQDLEDQFAKNIPVT